MKFVMMVWQAAGKRRLLLLAAMIITTMSPVGVLAVVNTIIQDPESYHNNPSTMVLFVAAAVGIIGGNAVGSRLSVDTVEAMLDGLRMRLADLVRRIEYNEFERIGSTRIYDTLTRNTAVISEAAMVVLPGYAALGSLALGGLYTMMLSPVVFAALGGLIAISILFYFMSQKTTRAALREAVVTETTFLGLFGHLLNGFKEVRLHRPRGNELEFDHISPASNAFRWARVESGQRLNRGISISYAFFYIMLGTIAFILPPFVDNLDIIVQSIYVAVFLLSMIEIIMKSVPLVARANFAFEELEEIEQSLKNIESNHDSEETASDFESIRLESVVFNYRDTGGAPIFTVGPINLEIKRGETLFVVGGNGSGKSTFLKVLCRLYPADSGTIVWDKSVVDSHNASIYRSLYTAVFTDFHLFDQLYGLSDLAPAQVNDLLQDLGIGHKVTFSDGRFSTTELSTGQRKRLAFAVGLLENRPIMILDELAADQDHEFRERFYREILPDLKRQGRTLIVVSHDDRYFSGADRIVTIRDGQLINGTGKDSGETSGDGGQA